MTSDPSADPSWADRAAARSPMVKRSRSRSIQHAKQILDAAIELINEKGSAFTIQELSSRAKVAMQTFYRHFAGKDELLLAVVEQTIGEAMFAMAIGTRELADPLSRLKFLVTAPIFSLSDESLDARRRFITAEHYRLHQLFPDELSEVDQVFTELLIPEINAAVALGQLTSIDVESDAWYITEMVMAIYHHYSFATSTVPAEQLSESVWNFCLKGLGGSLPPPPFSATRAAPANATTTKSPSSRSKSART